MAYRAKAGRLHRVHRGVYAVGSPYPSQKARWLAAVLACGEEAVLSHHSAAGLWEIREPRGTVVHVTVSGSGGRKRRAGIIHHRSLTLSASTVTRRDGIPVTTPARTISDLRGALEPGQLRAMIREADAQGLAIGPEGTSDGTRSELEYRFLRICRRYRLPQPEVNARVGKWQVDFLWRDEAVIVETDGYRFHSGRIAFEDDRVRGLELRALGYEVIPLSHRQVFHEPRQTAAKLRTILSGAPIPRPSRRKRPASA